MDSLIKSIEEHEGFVGNSYKDNLGFDTIGFGTKLPLSKDESRLILQARLNKMIDDIKIRKTWFVRLPEEAQDIISEMAYQMGVNGVMNFKKMWEALHIADYIKASEEMMNSRWAIQTPNRAKKLSDKMRSIV